MKKIKFVITFFIFLVGILIIGESYIFYLESFESKFYTSNFYILDNINDDEAFYDFEKAAKKNNVTIFTYNKSLDKKLNSKILIYGTEDIEKVLYEEAKIENKEYKSIFLGNISFDIQDFKLHPDIKNANEFYISGEYNDIKEFKRNLVDKYGGNFPKEGYQDNDIQLTCILIWSIIIIIVLFFSFYDTILQKKENLIKLTFGSNLHNIVLKNIILDLIVFTFIFSIIVTILSKYTSVFFMFETTVIFFLILLILNSLLYLNLYNFKLKEIIYNTKSSKKLLSLNYGVKYITTVLAILIISSNIIIINQCYELYTQRNFFENYSDYYYTHLGYKISTNDDNTINDRSDESLFVEEFFYNKYYNLFDAILLTNTPSNIIGYDTILTNKNSYNYISDNFEQINNLILDKDFYFIIPTNIENKSEVIKILKEYIEYEDDYQKYNDGNHFFDEKYTSDIITYNENKKIISIDNKGNGKIFSRYIKNPIIIYNNMDLQLTKRDYSSSLGINQYSRSIMYKISDVEFEKFISENGLLNEFNEKRNVLESYNKEWASAKRILIINLIFTTLIILLEVLIIISIIKLEYEVNAIEISLKKILGYTIFEKNKKIMLLTLISSLISIITSIILGIIFNISELYSITLGGLLILILEIIIIVYYIRKVEKSKVSKILKGGSL